MCNERGMGYMVASLSLVLMFLGCNYHGDTAMDQGSQPARAPQTGPATRPQLVAEGPLTVVDLDGQLRVQVRLRNQGEKAAYLFDRLWTLANASEVVPDSARAYRFVDGRTLRLVLGWAPLPRDRFVTFRIDPHATRIGPGETVNVDLSLELPVKEYNVYFDDPTVARFRSRNVNTVEVIAQYAPEDTALVVEPSKFIVGAFKVRSPRLREMIRELRLVSTDHQIGVLCRTDAFERFSVPSTRGE